MTTKSLLGAAALALAISSPAHAATYDFSFDASAADSGDTSLTAVGTFETGGVPGFGFDASGIIGAFSFTVSSDALVVDVPITATATDLSLIAEISADGQTISFLDFSFEDSISGVSFGCSTFGCADARVTFSQNGATTSADFATQQTARAAFSATAQVSAVPLPTGGLLLLSGLAGVVGLKRRRKRAA